MWFALRFFAYGSGSKIQKKDGTTTTSPLGHIYVAFIKYGEIIDVSGFGWNGFSNESHLLEYSDKALKVNVSKDEFYEAKRIEPAVYAPGFNDCVSYVKSVANTVGLETPSRSDGIAQPITYLEYLIDHNSMCRILK